MIDHEAEIFHSVERIETLINDMQGMATRAGRMMRTAEGFTATGVEYRQVYKQSEDLLSRAIRCLSEERAALIQLQIDAIELRRLNSERQAYGEAEEDLTADARGCTQIRQGLV